MEILYDTREKKNRTLIEELEALGVMLTRQKLDTGDYVNAAHLFNERYVVIDRKGGGLNELSKNVFQERARFTNELLRARQNNIFLVVLIVEENILSLEDVRRWTPPPFRSLKSENLYKIIRKLQLCFSDCVRFEFVQPDQEAQRIVSLLS